MGQYYNVVIKNKKYNNHIQQKMKCSEKTV